LHNHNNFKFFTFSNLFPLPKEVIKEKDKYYLVISSPKDEIIDLIFCNSPIGEIINLGEYSFILRNIKKENIIKLDNFNIFRTATLINITKRSDKGYKALLLDKDADFLDCLNRNCLAKYNTYFSENNSLNLFENCKVESFGKKSVSIKIHNSQKDYFVIGNLIDFKFGALKKKQREILEFLIDCGFGERTTYGFGYVFNKNNNDVDELENFTFLVGE
jgi:CRISPR-associated endoribonuclease Cas6